MRRRVNRLVLTLLGISIFLSCSPCFAEGLRSPFNGLELELDEEAKGNSFLMGGHLYGAPEKGDSLLPSSSILNNIDTINASGAAFFTSLGDNFRHTNSTCILNFKESFASRIDIPIFNAVGNHDVRDRLLYEQNFGKTYFHFIYSHGLFVFLDTEGDKGDVGQIKGEQLEYFQGLMETYAGDPAVKNLFIFSHKLIWSVDNPAYRAVFDHVNSKSGYPNSRYNFEREIEPYLIKFSSNNKAVYWCSGDIGTSASFTLFFQKDTRHNITYIASGIGDTEEDAIIKVALDRAGKVTFAPLSLSGQKLQPIEYYNDDYWRRYFDKRESRKARLKKIKYFSLGALSVLVALMLFSLRKKIGRK